MRFLIQRVSKAKVDVEGRTVGKIGKGLLILAGFGPEDDENLPGGKAWKQMIDKALGLRIFPDAEDKMNLSVKDFGGEILCVSQFTLYADCRKGKRPSFSRAAKPQLAERLYEQLLADLEKEMPGRTGRGEFGAMMDVDLTNWGPVTIWLDSEIFTNGN